MQKNGIKNNQKVDHPKKMTEKKPRDKENHKRRHKMATKITKR